MGKAAKPAQGTWTLASALAGWDDAALSRLFTLRPDLLERPVANWQMLADRASTDRSLVMAFTTLDRGALQVLGAVLTTGADVERARAAELLGADPDELERPLGELVARALVFVDGDMLKPAPGFGRINLSGLGRPARHLLNLLPRPQLETIALLLGLHCGPTNAELVEAIAAAISEPQTVAGVAQSGPKGTVELVGQLLEGPPTVMVPYGTPHDRTPAGYLLRRGILVMGAWNVAEMPFEVAIGIRGGKLFPSFDATAPDLATQPAPAEAVDAEGCRAALGAVASIGAIVEEWSLRPAKLLRTGGVGVRDLRRLKELLERSDFDTARLVELAGFAGLVGTDRIYETFAPTSEADAWLAGSPGERWVSLASTWLDAGSHLSVAGTKDDRGKLIPPLMGWQPDSRMMTQRRTMLEALQAVERGRAAEVGSLLDRAAWSAPQKWQMPGRSQAEMATYVLEEAQLLGLVSGTSLTSIGRALLDGRVDEAASMVTEAAPRPTETIVIQADFTAIVAGEMAPEMRRELDLMADQESSGAAAVYRFSESSLRRAFDAGRDADSIIAFLEKRAAKGVPQTLTYLVTDIARRHALLRTGTASSYLRSDDPALLAEACRHKKLASLHLRLLAPTVAVSSSPASVVVDKLRATGFFPAEEGFDGTILAEVPAEHRVEVPPARHSILRSRPGAPPAAEDIAAVVAHLRKSKPAAAPAATAGASAGPDLRAFSAELRRVGMLDPDDDVMDEDLLDPMGAFSDDRIEPGDPEIEPNRPTQIARTEAAIRATLRQAIDWDWAVRISFSTIRGEARALTIAPYDENSRSVLAYELPADEPCRIPWKTIMWVRVLTKAEEEQFR